MVQWRYQQLLSDYDDRTSYLDDLAQFLQTAVLSRAIRLPGSRPKPSSRVILVDGVPAITSPEMQDRWKSLLTTVKAMAVRKLVIVVISDFDPRQLERDFGADLLSGTKVLHFSSVTDRQMLKLLKELASEHSLNIAEEVMKDIVMHARGDLRSALNQLDLARTGDGRSKRMKTQESEGGGKDTHWNTFHALGKFLYNKREA